MSFRNFHISMKSKSKSKFYCIKTCDPVVQLGQHYDCEHLISQKFHKYGDFREFISNEMKIISKANENVVGSISWWRLVVSVRSQVGHRTRTRTILPPSFFSSFSLCLFSLSRELQHDRRIVTRSWVEDRNVGARTIRLSPGERNEGSFSRNGANVSVNSSYMPTQTRRWKRRMVGGSLY